MLRPMTSHVAALSSRVAKGHQVLHGVAAAPAAIPYGGFSSVRLQTRLTPQPPSPAYQRRLIARHGRDLRPRRLIRRGTCVQAAPRTSDHDRESSGPWLPHRWCCPADSSLTMATSAPLRATQRLSSSAWPCHRSSGPNAGSWAPSSSSYSTRPPWHALMSRRPNGRGTIYCYCSWRNSVQPGRVSVCRGACVANSARA